MDFWSSNLIQLLKYGVLTHCLSGADINCTNEQGLTPLVWAIDCGHEGIVRLLLDAGKNLWQLTCFWDYFKIWTYEKIVEIMCKQV